MKSVYIVTSTENGTIMVAPEQKILQSKDANSPDSAKISGIEVANPYKFKISAGTKVIIGLPQKKEAAAGLFALLVPIAAALLGFFISQPAANILNCECTEFFKAIFISAFFLVAGAFVFASSRTAPTIVKLQINKIVD